MLSLMLLCLFLESASFYDDGEARKRASDKDESPTDDLRTNMMKNVTYSVSVIGTTYDVFITDIFS